MNIIQTLGQKPWLDNDAGELKDYSGAELRAKKFALNMFLAVVSMLFSLFIVTFLARSQYPDFQALAGDVWQPFYNAGRLWVNTALLFLSSVTIQLCFFSLKREKMMFALISGVISLFFAMQFVVAQLSLWQHLSDLGYYVQSNPANSYFYVFTAIHGIHLIGGLAVLCQALITYWRKKSDIKFMASIQLCARYWHYLFVVWLILFALLTSSPETYKTLAALCGY